MSSAMAATSSQGEQAGRAALAVSLVAAAYSAAALLPAGGQADPDVALTLVCGLILGLAIVLVAPRLNVSRARQLLVWSALTFLNLAAVAIEGTLFAPAVAPASSLAANLIRLAIGSAVIACAVAAIFGAPQTAAVREMRGWWWRLIVAAGVYLVLYLVLGGVNYSLVTHSYYTSHAGSLTVPGAQTILVYEPIRGLLIGLSVLPLIAVLRARTVVVAIAAGSLLFIAGGIVPLLPQSSLPLCLRIASLWEILGQNFFTGVVIAFLFSRLPWRT